MTAKKEQEPFCCSDSCSLLFMLQVPACLSAVLQSVLLFLLLSLPVPAVPGGTSDFSLSYQKYVPSEPETLPPSAEVHPAGAFPLSGSESFPGHSLQPLNTDSCGSLCGASSLCPRRVPLRTFSGFWLRTVSSVHTSDWSVPFLRSLLFRIILFSLSRCSYIPLSATFVPLATVWIAPAVHVVFGIQEYKKRLLS